MRRIGRNGMVSLRVKSPAPPGGSERSSRPGLRLADLPAIESEPTRKDAAGTIGEPPINVANTLPNAELSERLQRLAKVIQQRIETRLPGRVRNLAVRIGADFVVLEGECSTYYTKQLAQHAALGVLEDEHLENAIVVTIGR
jgi:hypothetical protein